MINKYKIAIRRNLAKVKPEAEKLDGNYYYFSEGWIIDETESIYFGETAMLPQDTAYPRNAPIWIASGDLVLISEGEK